MTRTPYAAHTFGSLFSGIGGFDLALERAGMTCLWQSEIDWHASAVLNHHWPLVPNYGDITAMRGDAIPPVQVICGGFPCQDLSVAGKRAGLGGERSGLFFDFVRIAEEMRGATGGVYPELLVIENVPGLFSSHKGADFGVLLDALAECGALDIGWRVLDAQWFGVAQRRRRVFIVVDFRGRRVGEILSLTESLSGDSPPRRETRQDVAPTLEGRAGRSGATNFHTSGGLVTDVAGTLGGGAGERGWAPDTDRMTFVPIQNATRGKDQNGLGVGDGDDPMYTLDGASQHGVFVPYDPAQTVSSKWSKGTGGPVGDEVVDLAAHTLRADGFDASEDGTGRGTPLVPFRKSRRAQSADDHETWGADEVANTLNTFENGDVRTTEIIAFQQNQRDEVRDLGDVAGALQAEPGMKQQNYIAFTSKDYGADAGEVSPTLRAMPHDTTHANGGGQVAIAFDNMSVRRLTPTECERLQGFPDGWTVPAGSDSARYKALGNAVAVPVVERIGQQIVSVLL